METNEPYRCFTCRADLPAVEPPAGPVATIYQGTPTDCPACGARHFVTCKGIAR